MEENNTNIDEKNNVEAIVAEEVVPNIDKLGRVIVEAYTLYNIETNTTMFDGYKFRDGLKLGEIYETTFNLLILKPEMQDVLLGKVKDIADFGVFKALGPIEGMIHISQAMDDFVSFSKDKTLSGKESKKILKVGDLCKARVIAVSYKDLTNPKLGLTMRQAGLGRMDWIEEEFAPKKEKKEVKKKETKGKK